jgi:hypothetical protein
MVNPIISSPGFADLLGIETRYSQIPSIPLEVRNNKDPEMLKEHHPVFLEKWHGLVYEDQKSITEKNYNQGVSLFRELCRHVFCCHLCTPLIMNERIIRI